jgi:hypothetical protein
LIIRYALKEFKNKALLKILSNSKMKRRKKRRLEELLLMMTIHLETLLVKVIVKTNILSSLEAGLQPKT